jgi:hypothetical protein
MDKGDELKSLPKAVCNSNVVRKSNYQHRVGSANGGYSYRLEALGRRAHNFLQRDVILSGLYIDPDSHIWTVGILIDSPDDCPGDLHQV